MPALRPVFGALDAPERRAGGQVEQPRTRIPMIRLLRKCWLCIFVANFVEALVEKCAIRQRLRPRLATKFSARLTFATAFSLALETYTSLLTMKTPSLIYRILITIILSASGPCFAQTNGWQQLFNGTDMK